MELRGKAVRRYVENFYKHHKHKKDPSYIAGAVALGIEKKRTSKRHIHRKVRSIRKSPRRRWIFRHKR